MFKFVFLFFVVLLFYSYSTRNFVNPYKLIILFGPKGCGKSTFLTREALRAVSAGQTVFTNFGVPGTYPIEPKDLGHVDFGREVSIFIDEGALTWDNRQFKKFDVDTLQWLRLQRHYRTRVYISSQSYDLDSKIRMLADELWIFKRYLRVFSVGRRVLKKIVLTKPGIDGSESRISEALAYDFIFFPSSWHMVFIPRYVGLFDSFSCPVLPDFSVDILPGSASVPLMRTLFYNFVLSAWSDLLRLYGRFNRVRRAVRDADKIPDDPIPDISLDDFFNGKSDLSI